MLRLNRVLLSAATLAALVSAAPAVEVGDEAPGFTATGTDGKEYSLEQLGKDSELVVICFTCNSCPVAVAYEDRFIEFTEKYRDAKVTFVALNCNTKTENLDKMKERAEEKGFNFLYAFDDSGEAAERYGAKVTPELFVVQDGKIVYHGAYDDSLKDPEETFLVNAVDSLLAGETPQKAETKPFGCAIKN